MHNLALELQAHGCLVTGSDDAIFDPAKSRLQNAGLLPEHLGWFPEKINNELSGVILGMHARADNPELLKAKELNILVYSFPEYVYKHSVNKTRVVIGGSHGKTTSTAMLMHVLQKQKIDFDYLVGSQLSGFERMVKLSDAPVIVIEGDEYLTSALHPVPKFHVYKPHMAMITGIAWDHVNVFPTFENYVEQFRIFIDSCMPNAPVYWFAGDNVLESLSKHMSPASESYSEPDYRVTLTGTTVTVGGQSFDLQIFGKHNLQNAAGVQKLAAQLGVSEHDFWQAMQSFEGTARRLEKVFDNDDLVVFRDFAHAPSKVNATVAAVRERFPDHNMIAVFELHTYSSLRADFLPGYAHTLDAADSAFVLFDPEVYALKKMEVPSAADIENVIGNCKAFNQPEMLLKEIRAAIQKKPAVLLLMSSGNLGGITTEQLVN